MRVQVLLKGRLGIHHRDTTPFAWPGLASLALAQRSDRKSFCGMEEEEEEEEGASYPLLKSLVLYLNEGEMMS